MEIYSLLWPLAGAASSFVAVDTSSDTQAAFDEVVFEAFPTPRRRTYGDCDGSVWPRFMAEVRLR